MTITEAFVSSAAIHASAQFPWFAADKLKAFIKHPLID